MFAALDRFAYPVTTLEELAAIIGEPGPLAIKKELTFIDEHMRRFIAHAPFLVLGTFDAAGRADVSPRGDGPGFVKVLDEHTLLVPDRPGNRRTDSMKNILSTGRISLIFFVPGMGETLRVNGAARLFRDEDLLATMAVGGKVPTVGIGVAVEQCFLQCAKSIYRSKLWEPHTRPDFESLPCAGQMLSDQAKLPDIDAKTMQERLDGAYQKLY